ncbi:hypothetical protein KQH62_04400 [bacterium]|nr:hypothetical protein [bacterium]
MKQKSYLIGSILLIGVFLLSACTTGSTAFLPSASPEADADSTSQNSGGTVSAKSDTSAISTGTAANGIRNVTDAQSSPDGLSDPESDDFEINLFERPLSQGEMAYRPDLDIVNAILAENETFYFASITVTGTNASDNLPGAYAVELDTDLDGSGDLLVLAESLVQGAWSKKGVSVYEDANNDVGGATLLRPNDDYNGDSYETLLFSNNQNGEESLAAAGWNVNTQPVVSIAFAKSLIETDQFAWGIWAGDRLLSQENFDLHDIYSADEAGSPGADASLGAINLIDSTCRNTSGFTPENTILGLCESAYGDGQTASALQLAGLIGDIGDGSGDDGSGDDGSGDDGSGDDGSGGDDIASGDGSLLSISFEDLNGDGSLDENDMVGLDDDLTVNVRTNTCDGPIIRQTDLANLSVLGLDAGQYCVELDTGLDTVSPSTQLVDVPDDGGIEVDVGLVEDILGNGSSSDGSSGDSGSADDGSSGSDSSGGDSSGEDDSGGLLDGLLDGLLP